MLGRFKVLACAQWTVGLQASGPAPLLPLGGMQPGLRVWCAGSPPSTQRHAGLRATQTCQEPRSTVQHMGLHVQQQMHALQPRGAHAQLPIPHMDPHNACIPCNLRAMRLMPPACSLAHTTHHTIKLMP